MDNFIAHILVVDDDDGIRTLVKKYLSENKFLVSTAESAEDASKKIKIVEFDLIILDIMMPGKSGLDFINENKRYLATPIILLTAKGEPEERIEGLEIGAETSEEIALSIMAEIKAVLNQKSPIFLRDKKGPIHESGL